MSHSSQNVSIHLLSSKYNCLSVFLVIYKTSTFYMHQKYLQIALLLTRRSTFSLRRKVGDWEIFFGNFVDLCPLKSSWIWQKNLSKCLESYTRINNWYMPFLRLWETCRKYLLKYKNNHTTCTIYILIRSMFSVKCLKKYKWLKLNYPTEGTQLPKN